MLAQAPWLLRTYVSSQSRLQRRVARFATQRRLNKSSMEPKIAAGKDRDEVTAGVRGLIEHGWDLDKEQRGVQKTYHFNTYTKDFHQTIGVRSKSKNHHPEMSSKTGSLTVYWTTHHPTGLSPKDIFMANYCDEQAKIIGTVDEDKAQRCGPGSSSQI